MDSVEQVRKCFRKDELLLYKYFLLAYATPSLAAIATFSVIY